MNGSFHVTDDPHQFGSEPSIEEAQDAHQKLASKNCSTSRAMSTKDGQPRPQQQHQQKGEQSIGRTQIKIVESIEMIISYTCIASRASKRTTSATSNEKNGPTSATTSTSAKTTAKILEKEYIQKQKNIEKNKQLIKTALHHTEAT